MACAPSLGRARGPSTDAATEHSWVNPRPPRPMRVRRAARVVEQAAVAGGPRLRPRRTEGYVPPTDR